MKNSSLRHPGVLNRYPGCVEIVDSQNQRLVFTVGPVWLSCDKMGNSVGVWVNYQERDRDSEYKGPVFISEAEWQKIRKNVDECFADRKERFTDGHGARNVR